MSEKRLKTYMTQVFFKCPGCKDPRPMTRGESPSEVFLLDDLLGGGIVVPDDIIEARLGKPPQSAQGDNWTTPGLLMLVTGAPGSGKTTFALELCYRLAKENNSQFHSSMKDGVSSIYVSAEASSRSVIQNACSYGWGDENGAESKRFFPLPPDPQDINAGQHVVFLFGRDTAKGKGEAPINVLKSIGGEWWVPTDLKPRPQVLVIDSLNTLGRAAPEELSAILRKCANDYLLTIAIMDTGPGISSEHRWVPSEYMADIEIDFSYDRPENYMIRRMWVVKARFQDHADGWHRMKINPRPTGDVVPNPLNPVIKEGGIFIFPSVHRHLSLARGELDRSSKKPGRHPDPIETPFKALTKAIQGQGFPQGSCTAIIGDRGGMKSHLAYYTLLKFLQNHQNERAVIISLRDTQSAAIDTLADILWQQVDDNGDRLVTSLTTKHKTEESIEKEPIEEDRLKDEAKEFIEKELIEKDRLEVLYFWPGYISPEEFFHLVCTSVDRPGKGTDGCETPPATLLIINGLEQLSARFPLCAKENMFISGLLSVLTVKGITVLVTSGGLTGFPPEQGGVPAGLLPMSDLIVQSSFRLLPAERVWSSAVWFPSSNYQIPGAHAIAIRERSAKGEEPHVVYEIVREPGARECRRRVLFYMGREGDPECDIPDCGTKTGFVRGSVYVRPLPDEFPHGIRP